MNIRECMTADVECVAASGSAQEAARLMWDRDCGVIPVVNDEAAVVGMITDRDIAMAALTQNRLLGDIPVSQVMSDRVVSVSENDDLSVAEQAMQANQLRRVPVLDDQQQICGILSLNDIALAYSHEGNKLVDAFEVANTLASVCRPRAQAAMQAAI